MAENKNEAPQAAPQDENQIIAERRGKLARLRQQGQAFPNARMARMRPAVIVSMWSPSSSSCDRWPYESTSSEIVWRRSKVRG